MRCRLIQAVDCSGRRRGVLAVLRWPLAWWIVSPRIGAARFAAGRERAEKDLQGTGADEDAGSGCWKANSAEIDRAAVSTGHQAACKQTITQQGRRQDRAVEEIKA